MQDKLISAKQVCDRFGGVSRMTLHRWMKDERIDFPKPLYIRNRKYFSEADISAFWDVTARRALCGVEANGNPSMD